MSVKQLGEYAVRFGSKDIRFEQRVVEFLNPTGKVLVLLNVDDFEFGDPLVGRNILAFDEEGNELWRVADHGITVGVDDDTPEAFFGIDPIEGSNLILATTARWLLDLDPETGEVSNPRYRYPGM